MNLRMRGVLREPAAAALATMAAGRYLAAAGIGTRRIWVAESSGDPGGDDRRVVDAWARGTAVLEVAGARAREAAVATAEAADLDVADDGRAGEADPVWDGEWLAARFAFDLWPDETVVVVTGPKALDGLADRLAAFDGALADDGTPRRLVLAGLAEHGPRLAPDLVAAIVHPQVLVELRPSDDRMLAALARAADELIDAS
jgi:hypothetical protein